MTEEEFIKAVSSEPDIEVAIRRSTEEVPDRQFGASVGEVALIIAMFPIVQFVLTRIGLPWLYEVGRYSDLWRQRFHRWIDEEYREHGFDPEQAEVAGEALRKELEAATGLSRASWERLRDQMMKQLPPRS